MVYRDSREGRQLSINATPTVFINGKYLERISLGDISEMIAVELTLISIRDVLQRVSALMQSEARVLISRRIHIKRQSQD